MCPFGLAWNEGLEDSKVEICSTTVFELFVELFPSLG